jgi:hypothetical protein
VLSTILDIDGKIGAEQGAQATVDAAGVVCDFGGMVAFGVGPFGHDKHVLRAKFYAEATSLAALVNDVHDATGYLDVVPIQGLSPECHVPSSIPR